MGNSERAGTHLEPPHEAKSKRERGGAGDVGRRAVTAAAVWRTAELSPAVSLTLLRPLGRDATGAARDWPEGARRRPAGYAREEAGGDAE